MALSFTPHAERAGVLAELHVRPFLAYPAPHRFHHFAFVIEPAMADAEREAFARLAGALGVAPPPPGARFHLVTVGAWQLRWELHTEFVSYLWSTTDGAETPFSRSAADIPAAFHGHVPAGTLLVAVDLALTTAALADTNLEALFERSTLSVITAAEGAALVATDFRARDDGLVRFVVAASTAMTPTRAGRLVQRLLELETYRCLALLGLSAARQADPLVRRIEAELLRLSSSMASSRGAEANARLLGELTDLSARLEASIAAGAFRLAATRAYAELVRARVEVIRETEHAGYMSFSRLLRRRFNPAIATCAAIESRQRALSERLGHAVDLLRTRIQSDLEAQNGALLAAMNRRSRLQLRLQQTVEGLSIAAISYYIVGLVGYLAKGAKDAHVLPAALSPEIVMALAVPVVAGGLYLILERARRAWHRDDAESH
ncbi:MAG: DUF3422 domain-containing protein [Hyphomicrobiaceae bacterium]